jgi:hypothetical protein
MHAAVLAEEAFTTAAIEGEKLDRQAIKSSVARRMGLPEAGLPPAERHVDGLVEMLADATAHLTDWLLWFMKCQGRAIQRSEKKCSLRFGRRDSGSDVLKLPLTRDSRRWSNASSIRAREDLIRQRRTRV